ncbi:MAG: serine/threonine protein kinase, partial [Candidatus Bathyarchaeota archaeon]|nr:serine/threonine protein kinase [Candidatus Bathyarchaeota archaeon]
MSSVDVAVSAFKEMEPEDLRALSVIEVNMSRYRFVPEEMLRGPSELPTKEVTYRLRRLDRLGLIIRSTGSYVGYALNRAGYDCLAINALVKGEIIEAIGKPLGVGKEADVYDALAPDGERVAAKFHHLGRISFRQSRRLRGYIGDRRHISWLYRSRLAA